MKPFTRLNRNEPPKRSNRRRKQIHLRFLKLVNPQHLQGSRLVLLGLSELVAFATNPMYTNLQTVQNLNTCKPKTNTKLSEPSGCAFIVSMVDTGYAIAMSTKENFVVLMVARDIIIQLFILQKRSIFSSKIFSIQTMTLILTKTITCTTLWDKKQWPFKPSIVLLKLVTKSHQSWQLLTVGRTLQTLILHLLNQLVPEKPHRLKPD